MKKYIDETKEGQSISAFVILNKEGKHIANVRFHYSNSGKVAVEVHNIGENIQRGSAGGYGYDKVTTALSGLNVGGIILNDHCGTSEETNKLLDKYQSEIIKGVKKRDDLAKITESFRVKAEKVGASFSNYASFYVFKGELIPANDFDGDPNKFERIGYYKSLYLAPGLDKLKKMGLIVIQAI